MILKALETLKSLVHINTPTQSELEAAIDLVFSLSIYKDLDKQSLMREAEAWYNITADNYSIIQDAEHYKTWLPDKKSSIEWRFWERYGTYLKSEKKFPTIPFNRLDTLTDDILDHLFNPMVAAPVDKRGLVVGQVQSGKTSNYVGLICKAADAGFKIIIVMAGVHDNLRSQTQVRIDEGFIGFDTQTNRALDGQKYIGVGNIKVKNRADYSVIPFTSSLEKGGDFTKGNNAISMDFSNPSPIILVVKKNVSVLKRVHKWLASNSLRESDGNRTIDSQALLLIDDEADHASINTSKKDITKINENIRDILKLFSRSAYVGYTATPFANIFIPIDDDDLFPKDFIINLPAPSNYIGPEKVFGYGTPTSNDPEEDDNSVLPIVCRIDDFTDYIPDGHKKDGDLPEELPPSLKYAIQCFILTCAIRRVRGQVDVHNSMLVHVTRYNRWQAHIKDLVEQDLKYFQRGIALKDMFILKDFQTIFETEYKDVSQIIAKPNWQAVNIGVEIHEWETVLKELHHAAAKIITKSVNGGSADILDFVGAKKGISVIAIGGDKLSRGLTLEGLSVSYYLRASKMYDTLMQMGRWFGYRKGYIDLCRLFTSQTIQQWYCHIAGASDELRHEFDYMKDFASATPKEFTLKVRTHPGTLQISASNKLQITAPNKMRHAVKLKFTFSSHLAQTYILQKDKQSIEANFQTTQFLLNELGTPESLLPSRILWRTKSVDKIIQFLRQFRVHRELARTSPNNLISYIQMKVQEQELLEWVIVLPLVEKEAKQIKAIRKSYPFMIDGKKMTLPLTIRTPHPRSKDNSDGYHINRNNLLSPRHEFFDIDQPKDELTGKKVREDWNLRPCTRVLMLLYPLDPTEITTETDMPMMGVAISFPRSRSAQVVEYAAHEQLLDNFNYDEPDNPNDEN